MTPTELFYKFHSKEFGQSFPHLRDAYIRGIRGQRSGAKFSSRLCPYVGIKAQFWASGWMASQYQQEKEMQSDEFV